MTIDSTDGLPKKLTRPPVGPSPLRGGLHCKEMTKTGTEYGISGNFLCGLIGRRLQRSAEEGKFAPFRSKAMAKPKIKQLLLLALALAAVFEGLRPSAAFQSDELLLEDDEFGLEGSVPDIASARPSPPTPTRRRSADPDTDSKIQFTLEHAFGDSDFSATGTFSARLKTWNHGGQTLTKLRFSRNTFTESEKEQFKKLLNDDDFYRIRLPSNVLDSHGPAYVVASVKARCLPRDGLDEHFVIHMEGVNVIAVNYGAPGACPYPRQLKLPSKWAFNSHTVLKSSEQAPRTPVFTEEITVGQNGEVEIAPPPEKSFWAKYWMYLIPLGLIVMNAVTQAANMPEEQAGAQGQPGGAPQRAQGAAVRRR